MNNPAAHGASASPVPKRNAAKLHEQVRKLLRTSATGAAHLRKSLRTSSEINTRAQ